MSEFLQAIVAKILNWFTGGTLDVGRFLSGAAQYAATNISPVFLKTVAECVAAADLIDGEGKEKKAFAWSNIIAILEKEAIAFAIADVNFAIESVIQQRNAQAAKAANPLVEPPTAA